MTCEIFRPWVVILEVAKLERTALLVMWWRELVI